jgi:hypothetical protein
MLLKKFIYFLIIATAVCAEEDSFSRERVIIIEDPLKEKTDYEWCILGGGVSGITALAVLHDLGIPYDTIFWTDPLFKVGRIGEYYLNVPGNTPNWLWADFLSTSPTISAITKEDFAKINLLDPKGFSNLSIIAEPMQKVTDYFLTQVNYKKGFVDSLEFFDDVWHVGVDNQVVSARNVILATGCKPRIFEYAKNADIIPLDYALDKEILAQMVKPHDTIAVFGGSHSAILILKYLSSCNVKEIFNFFKHPLLYAVDMGSWTLYGTNGLKGETAIWARDVLEKNPPKNLFRIENTKENRDSYLKCCNKVIYAVGYEKNSLPSSSKLDEFSFNPETGIIGTRIFGIGLAFPGEYTDFAGNKEQLIGVNSFMKFALQVMPDWLKERSLIYKEALSLRIHQLSFLDNFLKIQLL